MKLSSSASALLAAAALGVAASAQAQTTTTATLAGFRIDLADLDPSDGLAPSLVLDPQARSGAYVQVQSENGQNASQQGASAFGAVSAGVDVDGSAGSAAFSGDPFGDGARITASATGGGTFAIGWGTATVLDPSYAFPELVLGARSQVTFSGMASIDWSDTNTGAVTYALIDLRFWQVVDGSDVNDVEDFLGTAYYGQGAPSGSISAPIGITFANDSDSAETVVFDVALRTYATNREAYPSPVDEPAGAALLAIGACMLSGLRRRRALPGRAGSDEGLFTMRGLAIDVNKP